jgi:hypothetical protein
VTFTSTQLLATVWSWIEEHLGFFDPRYCQFEQQLPFLKAFDELCLLGVLKYRQKSDLYLNEKLVRHCLSVVAGAPIPTVFVDNIAHFQLMAMPAALQVLAGSGDYLKQLVQLCVPKMSLIATERLPHRLLDVIYCSKVLGIEDMIFRGSIKVEAVQLAALQSSNLSLGVYPHQNTIGDFYALTHTIFFVTDFGQLPMTEVLPGVDTDNFSGILELAILRFLCEENLDIVAELMWCLLILDTCKGPVAALAAVTIAGCIETFGYLRGPNFGNKLPISEDYSLVYKNYHSTLLAAALFSNGLIERVSIPAANGSVENFTSVRLSSFYEVGKQLHRIAVAHPVARYELTEVLIDCLRQHPYLAACRFIDAIV